MKIPKDSFKKIIVSSGLVNEQDFDSAAISAEQLGKSIEDILVFRGLITSDTIARLTAQHLGVPYADLSHMDVTDEALQLLPENLAQTYHMVPLSREGDKVKLIMSDPTNVEALEFARRYTGLTIEPYYGSIEDIRRALALYKRNVSQAFSKILQEETATEGGKVDPKEDLSKAAEKVSIIKVLDTILSYAVAERASDIHIETEEGVVMVRFRVDGELRDIVRLPRSIEEPLIARIKILSNLKLDERRIPQDGRYKFVMNEEVIALRISVIPGFYGENVVMRILRESARPLSLEELGVIGKNLELVTQNIRRPNGMILVTGPTGSGKTTTLYSVLNILNTIEVKLCTIEDPIEYGINRVTQIQVNPKAGLDFAAGLRALLRHDPDIIMVGEIRDHETAEIAVHSALTGHLVLSTLHTNDAAGAIPRLLDMGVEGYLAASTINAVIAQRLVRKVCSVCIGEYRPDQAILTKLERDLGLNIETMKFYRGKGCAECHGSGFLGRIGIYEVLSVSDAIRHMVINKVASDDILIQAKKEGMITMLEDGINKVSSGLVTIEHVLDAVSED